MKPRSVILLLFVGLSLYANAQSDSLAHLSDSLSAKLQVKKLDSLQTGFSAQAGSITQKYADQKGRIVSLKQRYLSKIDSLRSKRPNTGNPMDSLQSPKEISSYQHKLDSLDQRLNNVQHRTTARLDSLKGRVTEQVSKLKLPKEANGKVAGLTQAMDKVSLPSFDKDISSRLDLPDAKGVLPSGGLPDTNLPGIPDAKLPGSDVNLPNTNVNTPDVKSQLPGVDTDKINDVTGKVGDVQKQITDATASKEAMGKAVEDKAAEQVKGLPENKLPELEGMPGGVPANGDEAKKQLVDMGKKQAVNHFAGKEAALTTAMEKMSKYKQKYNSVNSLKDIKDDKRHNEMKGKPFIERLVPAVTFQFQSWQDLMLDINPSVGYRITPKITAGLGWNQRVAFNIPARAFNATARVYGIRSYAEYNFKKGFGIRADLECMNTPIKNKVITSDALLPHEWVWSALIGVKQKYPIYKKLKGNAQVMYNMFDRDHRSPYTDRINFRIGLEFTLRKKKREEKSTIEDKIKKQ